VSELHWLTAAEAARAVAARKVSPVELMTALLQRIGRLDPKLNVFIRLDAEAAMDAARAAEAEIAAGRVRGPLHQGHHRCRGSADHLSLQDPDRQCRGGRRGVRGAAARRRCDCSGQIVHA
jgi:hypothetical protein